MASRYVAKLRPGTGGAPKGTIPWNKGKKVNVTWGAAISRANKGKPKSAEWCEKMRVISTGKTHTEESKKKISLARMGRPSWCKGLRKASDPSLSKIGKPGEQHWNWQGGISSISVRIRQSSEYKEWRSSVFARDNWTRQKCLVRGGYLEAHHVRSFKDFPALRFDVDNGLTVCGPCHKEIERPTRQERYRLWQSKAKRT